MGNKISKLRVIAIALTILPGLGCFHKFNAKFEGNCQLTFPDSLNIKEVVISQNTMVSGCKYVPLEENTWVGELDLCKMDTTVFRIIKPEEYKKFKSNDPFTLFIRLNKRDANKYQSSYYKCYFKNGMNYNGKVEFKGITD